jgi:hypothetical protein
MTVNVVIRRALVPPISYYLGTVISLYMFLRYGRETFFINTKEED